MVNTTSTTQHSTQLALLHDYLRGTGNTLTVAEARSMFNISNLRARLFELRQAGLRVRAENTETRAKRYSIYARDVNGSRRSLTTSTK